MTKNEIYETEITGMTAEGSGVCRIDGMAVFVPMTAIGDILKVRIVKVLKSYAFGIIEELLEGSPERCTPDCPVFRQCGGCTFRHVNYQEELHYKEQFVHDVFERIGGLHPQFSPILPCEERDGYRNKAQYPVTNLDGHLACGFYARHSHRVIPFTKCRLQPEIFTQILEFLLPWLESCGIVAYEEEKHSGELRHIYLRRGYHSGEIMLCFITRISIRKKLQKHIPELLQQFPQIVSVSESINPDKTNVIMGKKVSVLMGQTFIKDTMCGCEIDISPQSFYQVNTKQAEKMYQLAKQYAQLSGTETLLDLYCGTGSIGLSMADSVRKLIGVEVVASAVNNAWWNAEQNSIANAEFFCGDAGTIADTLQKQNLAPDVIVLDPPRKGCDSLTIQAVSKMSPSRIVMISCNPATASRDCKAFSEYGYSVREVTPVDLFPATSAVECVLWLSK